MGEKPPTPKTSFLIKDATNANPVPAPVKIAPPPLSSLTRSRSLKSDRGYLKRYSSLEQSPAIPANGLQTDLILEQGCKACQSSDNVDKADEKANDNYPKERTQSAELPKLTDWQAVVNTHRRGSSMTFVSLQNWAQFDSGQEVKKDDFDWSITDTDWDKYETLFEDIKPLHGFISGNQTKAFLSNTHVPVESLSAIWNLADMDHDGSLSLVEFAVAMHCSAGLLCGEPLPSSVPITLRDSLLSHLNKKTSIFCKAGEINDSKTPEKSSLKRERSHSSPKGTVTFQEDSPATLPRSRPRPTKKLLSTTPISLQLSRSSSSFSSSEELEMDEEPKLKRDKRQRRKRKEDDELLPDISSQSKTTSSDGVATTIESKKKKKKKKKMQRDHSYVDLDSYRQPGLIFDGSGSDEEGEVLLPPVTESEDDLHSPSVSDLPPSMPAPKSKKHALPTRAPSKPDMTEVRSKSIPHDNSIDGDEGGETLTSHCSTDIPPELPPSTKAPKSKKHAPPTDTTSKPDIPSPEDLSEPSMGHQCPIVRVDSGSSDSSVKSGSSHDENISDSEEDPGHSREGYDRLEEDEEAPDIIPDNGEVFEDEDDIEWKRVDSMHVTSRPKTINMSDDELEIRRHRSNSLDSSIISFPISVPITNARSFCNFNETALAISFLNELNINDECMLDIAKGDDLKPKRRESEYKKPLINVKTENHELEKLQDMEFDELRKLIRNYELHNNALLNVNKAMRKELVKIQEQKFHLRATIASMRRV